MITHRVDGKELKDKIKMLLSFYTPSKIYYYGNYARVRAFEDVIEFTQVQIVGEAINTGLLEVQVQGEQYLEEEVIVMVHTEELKKIVNQIVEDTCDVVVADNYIAIESWEKSITIPVADSDVPKNLIDNHNYVKEATKYPINIKEINKAIAVVNQATKGVIVSYDNQAVYLENYYAHVNKGVRITTHTLDTPLGLTEGLYMPLYMIPVLKHLEGEYVTIQRRMSLQGEELVMLQGNGVTIHFQEWYSKDLFPLEMVKQLTQPQHLPPTPEYIEVLGEISTASTILNLDLDNGLIQTKDGNIVSEVPQVPGTPKVFISTEVMPKKAELRKYKSIEVGPSTVRFQGPDIVTIVATMEES